MDGLVKMDDKKIIMALFGIIVIILIVGIVIVAPMMVKEDCKLTILDGTIYTGDNLTFTLTDSKGEGIANQNIDVILKDKDKSKSHFDVVTDGNGIGTLKIDKNAGKYKVMVSYNGSDDYNNCNATKKITIKENIVQAEITQQNVAGTHTIMGEDGYYYIVDDNGNLIQNLGPSKQYYPNDHNAVYYPNAESGALYMDKSK